MDWSIHHYFMDKKVGLLQTLALEDNQAKFLKEIRKTVRIRIKNVFDEVKRIVKDTGQLSLASEAIYFRVKATNAAALTDNQIQEISHLIFNLNESERSAFRTVSPKFWTQGSYQYKTINTPYQKPPQEVDIDDGVYLPMDVFDGQPSIGHRLFFLLVDAALTSLANQYSNLLFDDTKSTCSRLKVPSENIHIDVPLYAVPASEFVKKEEAMTEALSTNDMGIESFADSRYQLEPDSVYLAVRSKEKWIKSDPKIVADWFLNSVRHIGEHTRTVSRFLKAWRDVQWSKGGPSSICLMKCAVDTLENTYVDDSDIGAVMLAVVNNLPSQFNNGVTSPDPNDSGRFLFPPFYEHDDTHKSVVEKSIELREKLYGATKAISKASSLEMLKDLFGSNVNDEELIKTKNSAPAYSNEPEKTAQVAISESMKSG